MDEDGEGFIEREMVDDHKTLHKSWFSPYASSKEAFAFNRHFCGGEEAFLPPCLLELTPRALRRYRNPESPEPGWDSERAYWESRSPIIRFGRYLQAQGWYDGQQEEELRKQARKDAIRSLNSAQRVGKPHSMHLFSDVYDEVPWNLEEQEQALLEHMQKYPSSYTEHIESNAKELERAGAVTSP